MADEGPKPVSRRGRLALHAGALAAAAIGVACLTSTRHTLSGTFDEGNHLAAGLEWWQFGSYTMWTENPPLPRLAIAALPYLHGMRLPARADWEPKTHDWDRSWEVGTDLLYAGDGFEANLGRARLGTLPFFLLALAAAWGLAGGARRPAAGLIAVALTATLPALVAHGALATTDMAFAGTFLLATLALWRWIEAPTYARAAALGAAVGLALLCKFSVLVFFPVTVLGFAAARRLAGVAARPLDGGRPLAWRPLVAQAALGSLAAALVTWAGYRFSIGRIGDLAPEVKGWIQILPPPAARVGLIGSLLAARLPMPELFHGIRFLAGHDAVGHEAYLLGKVAEHGFLCFYPIALLVKTPLPFVLLLLASLPLLFRRGPERWPAAAAALAAAGILLISLRSHVNLGIRHVFVLLPLAAIAIARTLDRQLADWRGRKRLAATVAVALLLAIQAGDTIAAHSTELGFFNVLAGADPAKVLLDSDLDWGQDLFQLRREARARGIDNLKIAFFGMLRQCRHDLPHLEPLRPHQPTTGWIAISENYYRERSTFMLLRDPCDPKSRYRSGQVPPHPFTWLESRTPVAIAGSSIRLYHVDAAAAPP
jgi:4-amino-4-deoxy-L-arabinose transferase-like glycosyltransferase